MIELATRRIEVEGITSGPNEAWMMQVGRNLTDPYEGFLATKTMLIIDRDSRTLRAGTRTSAAVSSRPGPHADRAVQTTGGRWLDVSVENALRRKVL